MPGQLERGSSPAPAPRTIRRPALVPALAGLLWVAVAAQLLIAAVGFRLGEVVERRVAGVPDDEAFVLSIIVLVPCSARR